MIKAENFPKIPEKSLKNPKNLPPSFDRRMGDRRDFTNFFDDRRVLADPSPWPCLILDAKCA